MSLIHYVSLIVHIHKYVNVVHNNIIEDVECSSSGPYTAHYKGGFYSTKGGPA